MEELLLRTLGRSPLRPAGATARCVWVSTWSPQHLYCDDVACPETPVPGLSVVDILQNPSHCLLLSIVHHPQITKGL